MKFQSYEGQRDQSFIPQINLVKEDLFNANFMIHVDVPQKSVEGRTTNRTNRSNGAAIRYDLCPIRSH